MWKIVLRTQQKPIFYFTLRFGVIHQKFPQVVESTKSAVKSDMVKKGNNNTIVTAILVHFNLIGVPNDQQRLSKDNTLVATAFVKLIPSF